MPSDLHDHDEYFASSPETWRFYVLPPILGLLTITTVFSNLFVLYDFAKRFWTAPHKLNPTHFFIVNLATADCLVGIIVLPFLGILTVAEEWIFGNLWCSLWTFLHFWLCAASILSTTFVCVDRYIGVKHPFRHSEIFKGKNILLTLLFLWILAGIPASLRVFVLRSETTQKQWAICDLRQDMWKALLAAFIVLYIPVSIMGVLYSKIYFIAKDHMKKKEMRRTISTASSPVSINTIEMESSSSNGKKDEVARKIETENSNETKSPEITNLRQKSELTAEEQQFKLAKRLSFLVGVLIASYFPYFTVILVRTIHPELVSRNVYLTFAWIRYFNSCINPFIYAYAMPTYRQSFRRSVSRVTRKWSTNPSSSIRA